MQHLVELARRGEVATERLLDDHPRVFGGACLREPLGHRREHAWRDRQVLRGALGLAQLALEPLEGLWVFVVAVDVAEVG